MRQAPIGESGEIYIGGAGLARGYRNQPDLTAERFVPDPFSSEPGARLFRTGDLGRYLPDGQVAFLGRIDEQIKIRGFRIEPAEIVKVLDEHPAVQAGTVVDREVEPGDKRLVAYFVPAAKAQPTHTELRNFIAARVPERSEEHTSELQSRLHLVCRLLLEKKKKSDKPAIAPCRLHRDYSTALYAH